MKFYINKMSRFAGYLGLIAGLAMTGHSQGSNTELKNHEILLGGPAKGENPLVPTKGIYSVATVDVLPEKRSDGLAILGLARTNGVSQRLVGELSRPAKFGEHLRLDLSARLTGSNLQFGLGSNEGGVTVSKSMLTFIVMLVSDGTIAYYNGHDYVTLEGLRHEPGVWQKYRVDYVVGAEKIRLIAGDTQVVINKPFSALPAGIHEVVRAFVSTASATSAGEVCGFVVSSGPPEVVRGKGK